MKKLKKIIIIIIYVIIVGLIIYFSKDYIIRQYFIRKIENADYADEYIITTSYNENKKEIAYYSDDFGIIKTYDDKGDVEELVEIYDYTKNVQYEYYKINNKIEFAKNQDDIDRPLHLNNDRLLKRLKNGDKNKRKFKYMGMEKINNKECYVLYFEDEDKVKNTFYLDKENLYVVRENSYDRDEIYNNIKLNGNYILVDYEIDFDLRQKDLFKIEDK